MLNDNFAPVCVIKVESNFPSLFLPVWMNGLEFRTCYPHFRQIISYDLYAQEFLSKFFECVRRNEWTMACMSLKIGQCQKEDFTRKNFEICVISRNLMEVIG